MLVKVTLNKVLIKTCSLLNIGFTNLNDTLNGRKNTLAWRIMSEPRDLSEHTDNFNIDKHNLIMSIFQT